MKQSVVLVVFAFFCLYSCNFKSTTNDTSIDDSVFVIESVSIGYSSENDGVMCEEKCETLQAKSSFFDNANSKLRGINLFPIDDDVALGKQVYDEINSDDSYTKYS